MKADGTALAQILQSDYIPHRSSIPTPTALVRERRMLWLLKKIVRKLRSRRATVPPAPAALIETDPTFLTRKAAKLERIRPLLRTDLPWNETSQFFDFLSDELCEQFHIVETENVSSNPYDPSALALIEQYKNGLILDCGAGRRSHYFDNVVNFEICNYDSTDVRGVGERLPFRDGTFDAVFSFAVLEHVRDPFACAKEIIRILKPHGQLYCVVPFLQPLHGYPHHYYNMTHQGLRSLFENDLSIENQDVRLSGHPIWSLTWIIARWAAGLSPLERLRFLNMRLSDMVHDPLTYLDQPFVTKLDPAFWFELASTTSLVARKPGESKKAA